MRLPRTWAPFIQMWMGAAIALVGWMAPDLDRPYLSAIVGTGLVVAGLAVATHLLSRLPGGVDMAWMSLLVGGWLIVLTALTWPVDATRVNMLLAVATMLTAVVTLVEHAHYARLARRDRHGGDVSVSGWTSEVTPQGKGA